VGRAAYRRKFESFFQRFFRLKDERELSPTERLAHIVFCINIFSSLEEEMVRAQVLRVVSLPLWHNLSQGRLKVELHGQSNLAKHWKHLAKKEAKAAKKEGDSYTAITSRPEVTFIPSLLSEFLEVLQSLSLPEPGSGKPKQTTKITLLYCERFVELLVDLLSQLPTRRFTRVLLEDSALLIKIQHAALLNHASGQLFAQLVDLFAFYMNFEIDDHTGEPLSDEEVSFRHSERITQLQRLCFRHIESLRELAMFNCGQVADKQFLSKELARLNPDELVKLATKQLCLVNGKDSWAENLDFLKAVVLQRYEARRSQREAINEMPLYPTESVLWDESQIPMMSYAGDSALALPKLNLQFLTAHDYLLRNFNLFRLEATYEIREDLSDVLARVRARLDDEEIKVHFTGWSRMAIPLHNFAIVEVKKPDVGQNKPAAVTADVVINTKFLRGDVRSEWDELKEHDVLFLLTIRPPTDQEAAAMHVDGREPSPMERFGLVYCRGCEVIEVKDEDGKLMNDFTGRVKIDQKRPPRGFLRTLTVALDTAQYQADTNKHVIAGGEDVYNTFNLLMRRKPKENNFKAVLESIRDLMNEPDASLPPWLHDIFLGYEDPGAAHYLSMEGKTPTVDFKDTFVDLDHVKASFPGNELQIVNNSDGDTPVPPFKVTFPWGSEVETDAGAGSKRKADSALSVLPRWSAPLVVESYAPPHPGPYPQDRARANNIRFTPVQVEAVLSGVQPGLSMVVGPPGTGKTDVAVQIMNVLYNTNPDQRTLLITHSNQALNDLFSKIMERDIPARYLLRLGQGEQDLDTELDFSRVGRVNAMLERRIQLLAEVEKMAVQFGVPADAAYTCETAAHFWLLHVLSRWEKFRLAVDGSSDAEAVAKHFPFTDYFASAPQPLFKKASFDEDWQAAEGCFRHLKTMFKELEECRAFELLKGQRDRVNYLMTRQAKIVAMTCTHAALKRGEFLRLGFKYDNLLMEESAQILEIETFIPMLLQRHEDGISRLKRVVLIGDHHQLPPVVKNQAFQKYSHLDQSLFTRFVRLGTPYTELNAQGRARPTLAGLYNWRYRDLGNLPNVTSTEMFKRANPGMRYDYQFVEVPDFMGKGETSPTPYFYQNLGEAEFIVSLYCYLRLRGYPAHKISILTTYNGQKALIRDVIDRRCHHAALGHPRKVATVDKYQGQQNEIILLSLVRTQAVGHLRDVRRLTVAMSRARLGLYIVGRRELFGECFELQPTMKQLLARPPQLVLIPNEKYDDCDRMVGDNVPDPRCLPVQGVEHMTALASAMLTEYDQKNYAAWQAYHDVQAAHTAAEEAAEEAAAGEEAVAMDEDAADPAAGGDAAVADGGQDVPEAAANAEGEKEDGAPADAEGEKEDGADKEG